MNLRNYHQKKKSQKSSREQKKAEKRSQYDQKSCNKNFEKNLYSDGQNPEKKKCNMSEYNYKMRVFGLIFITSAMSCKEIS